MRLLNSWWIILGGGLYEAVDYARKSTVRTPTVAHLIIPIFSYSGRSGRASVYVASSTRNEMYAYYYCLPIELDLLKLAHCASQMPELGHIMHIQTAFRRTCYIFAQY